MCFALGLMKNTLGPSGIRTRDLPITSRMLYQLSYRPLDCQTAEIFQSNELIGGHGGVVILASCYCPLSELLIMELVTTSILLWQIRRSAYVEIISESAKVCTTSFPRSPGGDSTQVMIEPKLKY